VSLITFMVCRAACRVFNYTSMASHCIYEHIY